MKFTDKKIQKIIGKMHISSHWQNQFLPRRITKLETKCFSTIDNVNPQENQ